MQFKEKKLILKFVQNYSWAKKKTDLEEFWCFDEVT